MKFSKIVKRSLLALAIVPALVFATGNKALAAQIPYGTGDHLSTTNTPQFNVFTDVPYGIGNEADFVRVRPSNGNSTDAGTNGSLNELYKDVINAACNVGDMFDVRTYVHNGADPDYNQNGNGSAVARNVQLAMTAKLGQDSKNFPFTSTLTSSNAASVSDSGTLNCDKNVRLELVATSVKANTDNGWESVSADAVNGKISLGSKNMASGDVWACWDERIQIVYTVKVVAIPTPPVYTCDLLSVTKLADNKYRYDVKYTAKNGATFKDVTYTFGDGSTDTKGDSIEHTYTASADAKNVVATVNFMLNGTTVSHTQDKCKAKVTLTKENCPVPGKQNLPKDSADCKETPKELPNTGAGSTIGIFFGATLLGAFLYRVRALRGQN